MQLENSVQEVQEKWHTSATPPQDPKRERLFDRPANGLFVSLTPIRCRLGSTLPSSKLATILGHFPSSRSLIFLVSWVTTFR